MRNAIYIPMLLSCLLTAACSREAATDKNVSSAAADSAEVQAPVKEISPTDVVLADGYTPSFTHVLRSQRHEEAGTGTFRHVVVVEYLDAEREAVVGSIQADLTSRGFTIEAPAESAESSKLSARKGSLKLVADVNSSSTLVLNDPSAKGIVHFSWLDREAR